MSKICLNCGTTLDDEAVFCYNCKHNPDEERKRFNKKWLIVIAAVVVLAIGVAIAVISCSSQKGMKFVRVGEIDSITDEQTKDLIDSLSCLDSCKDDEYICILTDEASGEIKIPAQYKGGNVVYVTAYPGAGKNISSLVLHKYNKYLEYVCSFDSDNHALTSVTGDLSAYELSDCFNHCSSLEEAPFIHPYSIRNSFSDCASLKEIADYEPERYYGKSSYSIESSYCNCAALTEVKLKNFTALDGCFNGCDNLSTVSLSTPEEDIRDSFNDCASLDTLTFDIEKSSIYDSFNRCSSLESFTMIAQEVENAFNDCSSLTSVKLRTTSAVNAFNNAAKLTSLDTAVTTFKNAFNDCPAVKEIHLENKIETLTDSFKNCPIDVKSIQSDEEIRKEKQREEEEKRRKEQEEEDRLIENHSSDVEEIIETAWKKLYDSGAIPEKYPDLEFETVYDGDVRSDEMVFNDESVRSQLFSEPDFIPEKVAVYESGMFHEYGSIPEKRFATYFDECKYIISFEAFTSRNFSEMYRYQNGGGIVSVYGHDKTTLVYIIDAERKEIVAIHSVGTSAVTLPETTGKTDFYGEKLTDEAEDYIVSLLK